MINTGMMGLWALLLPAMGLLSDKIGRTKIMDTSALLTIVLAFPLFFYFTSALSLERVLIFQGILSLIGAAFVGPLPSFLSQLFPSTSRYSILHLATPLDKLFLGVQPL